MNRLVPPLLAVVLAACGGASGPGTAADGDARELRIDAAAGDSHSMRMRMEMGMQLTFDGEPAPGAELPVMAITTDLEVEEATGDAIRMTFGYRDLELTGGQQDVRSAMQQALTGMTDVTGAATVSRRGEMLDASVDLPGTLDPGLGTLMEQFEQQLGQLAVPFPEEPVAEGDSWTHESSLELSGVTTLVEATYTLRELEGDEYTIGVELTQTTEPGPIEGPDGQVVGEVVEGSSTGSGSFEGTLGFPIPTRGEMSTTGTTRMRVTGDAQEVEMVQEMDIRLRFRSSG